MACIPRWCRDIVEIVCMFEKEMPMSFMYRQDLLLIHLSDEVELAGVLSCHLIFFLKRYMQK
jgi:hypothetical protein